MPAALYHARSATRLLLLMVLLLSACTTARPYTTEPIRWTDPDDRDIPKPAEKEEDFLWNSFYLSTLYQLQKPLNLNWTFRHLGRLVGLETYDEADNVNALGEVPNSSWYTNRHFHHPMTLAALRRGPDTTPGPDTSRALTVLEGKTEGINPGFYIRDARGDVYLLKFDDPAFSELGSSSEVIATKIYYAAGYYVPQNTIFYFHPDQLVLDAAATVTEGGQERPMTRQDLQAILRRTARQPDGTFRSLASKFVEGEPVGIWEFRGTRESDPNDRVRHEQRRELRGLRVLAAWLNDADRRAGNTLAVYVEEEGRGYLKHYLLDMGSTLGTGGLTLRHVKKGHEYRYDPRTMLRAYTSLGLYVRPWAREVGDSTSFYPAVGYFEADLFDPARWVPNYPNPAFEKMTPRDAYWGARLVTAFTDEQIRAIVETARLTDPEARAYLIRTLIARRDEIGRYWFARVNPLDRFRLEAASGTAAEAVPYHLHFDDLAVTTGLAPADASSYRYAIYHRGEPLVEGAGTAAGTIPLVLPDGTPLQAHLAAAGPLPEHERVFEVRIRTRRGERLSEPVRVYVHYPAGTPRPRLAGLVRDV